MLSIKWRARGRLAAIFVALTALSGCATAYVDSNLQDLKPEEKVVIANPKPTQLLFEFQTKGVPNGQATSEVKQLVWNTVQSSGQFSQISDGPAPNGALLRISINDVSLDDDATTKGAMVGFSFGLAGAIVGDGYICTINYQSGVNAPEISRTLRDAVYASMGATAGTPVHAEKMPDFKTAVDTMIRRVVSNALNQLAKDSGFPK